MGVLMFPEEGAQFYSPPGSLLRCVATPMGLEDTSLTAWID